MNNTETAKGPIEDLLHLLVEYIGLHRLFAISVIAILLVAIVRAFLSYREYKAKQIDPRGEFDKWANWITKTFVAGFVFLDQFKDHFPADIKKYFDDYLFEALLFLGAIYLVTLPKKFFYDRSLYRHKEDLSQCQVDLSKAQLSRERGMEFLSNKIIELEDSIDAMFHDFVCFIFDALRMDSTERITVYGIDNKDKKTLRKLQRFSTNQKWKESTSRPYYETSYGIIGEVWNCGDGKEVQNCHIGMPCPISDLDGWLNYQEENFNFPREIANTLFMKPRSIVGFRMVDSKKEPVGLVIIESIKESFPQPLENFITSGVAKKEALSLIKTFVINTPERYNIDEVDKEGF